APHRGSSVRARNGHRAMLSVLRVCRAVDVRTRLLVHLLALDALEDLLAMHRNLARRIHAQAHLIAFHTEYSNGDIFADDDRFPHAPGQDQHSQLLLGLLAVPSLSFIRRSSY